jgi:threonine/homoserine/homoserine lactone efflux protein
MSLPLLFISAFGIAFSGALMPGPVLSAAIQQSSKHGGWAGLVIAAGHSIPEVLVAVGLFYGAIAFLEDNDTALGVIGLAGGGVLFLMAYGMFRYRPETVEAEAGVSRSGRWLEPLAAGAVTSMSNPHWYWWWAFIGLKQVADARGHAVIGLVVFYVGHVLADFVWFGIVGFVIGKGKRIAGGTILRWLIRFCAIFMAAMGAYFAVSGMGTLGMLK